MLSDVGTAAEELEKNGYSIIPILTDGSKAPAVPWKKFQQRIATSEEITTWFRKKRGIGIVAGRVSGNLEILDFDDGSLLDPWCELVKKHCGVEVIDELPIVMTPSSGFHVYYRSDSEVEGNQKLARRKVGNGALEVLIETRGEGGYVIAPESPPGCHPAKKSYSQLQGDLTQIPSITAEHRAVLLECARAFNEHVDSKRIISGPSRRGRNRPGDEFNERAGWEEILAAHGWENVGQLGQETHWRRPGKNIGISATTNFGGSDRFYNFSTNGHPFEAETSYTKFAAHALLNHEGDFSMAASDLAATGYGQSQDTYSANSVFSATQSAVSWPDLLVDAALYGLAGRFVSVVGPHTEADPAALLFQFICCFGNVIGRKPFFEIEADRHFTNLFTVVVGETSKSRKGTSWGHVYRVFEAVDGQWAIDQTPNGLSSGEGLIWAVRDPIPKDKDPGVSDKRLLVMEGEFAAPLKMLNRHGNTLSPVIRNAWDTGNLRILTKNSPATATGAHISIIGHISRDELLRHLDNIEMANGFGNRILWTCAKRSKVLPEGGNVPDDQLDSVITKVKDAVDWARAWDAIEFDEDARALWYEKYPSLSEGKPGLLGAMVARAESQVLRLACIYALLDISQDIREEHLRAALALWDYSEASSRYIFGHKLGDPLADRILVQLTEDPGGLSRTAINKQLGGHVPTEEIKGALHSLEALGLASKRISTTGGRPTETWTAVFHAEKTEKAE